MKAIKCVVVGDRVAGKTVLLIVYTTNAYPGEYVPTVFDDYCESKTVDGEEISFQLWDTAWQEDYKKLRPLSYPQTDVFVICFSLVHPTSLENVEHLWAPELAEHCPNVPFILVGTNLELRDQFEEHADEWRTKGMEPVPSSKGEEMKRKIGAKAYIECSARRQFNVKEVFETAIKVVLHPKVETPEKVKKGGKEKECGVE